MSKTFRKWSPDQGWLLPPSPRDWLDDGHLVYFLLDVVGEMESLTVLRAVQELDHRAAAVSPTDDGHAAAVCLLHRVFSSRKIQSRCRVDIAFRVIVGEDIPDFRTISDFRRNNLEHMESLFVQTLMVCAQAGLVKLGRVALDGAKVKANASRHKAMSYDRMQEEEARLQQEIAELMAKADAADADDDEQFGDRHGEELPDELARRQSRLEKIREAREALEAAAKQKAEDHIAKMETEGRNHRTDAEQAVPDDKAQRNFTDPESKIMKTSNKGYDQCGNAQAVATESQVIVAADVTDQANDVRQVEPMIEQMQSNIDAAELDGRVKEFIADAGYFSEGNVSAVESAGMDPFIATQRLKHNEEISDAAKGRVPDHLFSEAANGSQAPHEEGSGDLPQTEMDGRTGLRSDQGVSRFSSVFVERFEADAG